MSTTTTVYAASLALGMQVEDNTTAYAEVRHIERHDGGTYTVTFLLADGSHDTATYEWDALFTVLSYGPHDPRQQR